MTNTQKLLAIVAGILSFMLGGTANAIPIGVGNQALFSYSTSVPTPYIAGQTDLTFDFPSGDVLDPGEQLRTRVFDAGMNVVSTNVFNITVLTLGGGFGINNIASVPQSGFVGIDMLAGAADLTGVTLFLISQEIDPNTQGNINDRFDITQNLIRGNGVPEPSSLAVLGLGLAGLGVMRRRRKRA